MVWFNHAPLMPIIREVFNLTSQEVSVLLMLNVALTIPARIIVGMMVDNYGPRKMFSGILIVPASYVYSSLGHRHFNN